MVHSNVSIPLQVTGRQQESGGCLSLLFERPAGFDYQAGDWIDISAGSPSSSYDLAGGKTYSLSSSPTEPHLSICFRPGQSPLKRWLADARPGDTLTVTQYGNDHGFGLSPRRHSVLVAGGIGVAPFRSILRHALDTGSQDSATLIHLNRDDDVPLGDDVRAIISRLPNVSYSALLTGELKAKQRRQALLGLLRKDAAAYYLAGPPAMVASTKDALLAAGISADDIATDVFDGY